LTQTVNFMETIRLGKQHDLQGESADKPNLL